MPGSHSHGGHLDLRPLRYRTPSPPRHAVEPISPNDLSLLAHNPFDADAAPSRPEGNPVASPNGQRTSPWRSLSLGGGVCARASSATPSRPTTHHHHHQQQQQQQHRRPSTHSRQTSMSNIDALATIALATSPTFTHSPLDDRRISINHSPRFRNASMPPPVTASASIAATSTPFTIPAFALDDRPCKRPRSDGDPIAAAGPDNREVTAVDGSTFDISMKTDAELLLNLARPPNTTPSQSLAKPFISPSLYAADSAGDRRESYGDSLRLDGAVSPFTVGGGSSKSNKNNTTRTTTTTTTTQRRNTDHTHIYIPTSTAPSPENSIRLGGTPHTKPAYPAISARTPNLSVSSPSQAHEELPGLSGELESHPTALAFGHDHKSIHIQNHQNINFIINDSLLLNNPDFPTKDRLAHSNNSSRPAFTFDTKSTGVQRVTRSKSPLSSKPRRRRQRKSAAPPVQDNNFREADEDMEKQAKCASCKLWRVSAPSKPSDQEDVTWISCDGCNQWFHIVCAGFKNDREIRTVDRFICNTCRPDHGQTTFVRKSSRARTSIDYAGLNQGLIMAAKDTADHHYIRPIKNGEIPFLPDNFARLKPELITSEYFEHGSGMTEPIVVPASSNPRTPFKWPLSETDTKVAVDNNAEQPPIDQPVDGLQVKHENSEPAHDNTEDVYDCGQDRLGMVIPEGLTVRHVEKLYGSDERVEVIDVKSQQGEDKKWTMGKWADYYYDKTPNKPVRNVISLEVSQTPLGRLLRRPKIVRQFDLQDSVWPEELKAIGDYPHVQLYCLMSVKDSYTDFHIDFGGSSVYYHIIKGKKTFFFIPPRDKHLKKYEEWCNSAAQDTTFLGLQTEECYRVDLSAGDTMLIPSGWIHAVWTPEDSLVIGGNFLTRMSYAMQIKVSKIEKDTHVPRKFRYPFFQKIMWYTALKYLEDDPIPPHILERFMQDENYQFLRKYPIYHEFGPNRREDDKPGTDYYNSRYYSQPEVDGLHDLAKYLLRTALIAGGYQVDGTTSEARNAIKKSIPRSSLDPIETIRRFGLWIAWKRGNEVAPQWTKPNAFENMTKVDTTTKKVTKPGRRSQRNFSNGTNDTVARDPPNTEDPQPIVTESEPTPCSTAPPNPSDTLVQLPDGTVPVPSSIPITTDQGSNRKRKLSMSTVQQQPQQPQQVQQPPPQPQPQFQPQLQLQLQPQQQQPQQQQQQQQQPQQQQSSTGSNPKPRSRASGLGPKRVACDPCRRRRIRCRHKDEPFNFENNRLLSPAFAEHMGAMNMGVPGAAIPAEMYALDGLLGGHEASMASNPMVDASMVPPTAVKKGRSKACDECRRSKRRCIHDENGRIDPIKAQERSKPRASTLAKQRSAAGEDYNSIKQLYKKHVSMQGMEHHLMSPEMTARAALGLAGTMEIPVQNQPQQPQMYASPPSVKADLNPTTRQSAGASEGSHVGVASLVSPPTSLADDTDVGASELTSMQQRVPHYNTTAIQQTNQNMLHTTVVSPSVADAPIPPINSNNQTPSDAVASSYPDPNPFPSRTENASLLIQQSNNFLSKRVPPRSSSSHTQKGPASSSRRSRTDRSSLVNADADPESLRLIRELHEQEFGLRRRGSKQV
ncbi:JmjC domain-containing histone demethylation protein 1 [Ascosphaera pollenicola]|nr:JmjC domain-containing histone demethylation protein 1 [Ascosphaera pollenicola]